MDAARFWRTNTSLRDITPSGERFPEVGLFDALDAACTGVVFEFGCGPGRLAPAFDPSLYAGYDINPTAIQVARRSYPEHTFSDQWAPGDTFLAWTVMLHIPDDEIQALIDKAKAYPRVVIAEVMGRKWRRPGDPPVFNREAEEYEQMMGVPARRIEVLYPRYRCNLTVLVFDGH